MEKRIRVLHVLGGMGRGGAETMAMNIYRSIDRSKVQFDFVVHTDSECDYDKEIVELGGIIHRIPRYKGTNHLAYRKAWHKFFQDNSDYAIIHGHVRSTASIYLGIAKKYGLITIAHSHNTSSGAGFSAFVKNSFQYRIRFIADYLFACSLSAGKWLFGENACIKSNFILLKNAIDTKKFKYNPDTRVAKRDELGLVDKFVIGHVGRFHEQKNHTFIVDIFKGIKEKKSNAVLLLIGEGELKKDIEKKVENLELTDSVIFTGIRSDIPELLQSMDLFLFPSLHEGLPVTLIETQAAGLPSLVADTVTKEVQLTNMVKYLPLDSQIDNWVSEALKYGNKNDRDTDTSKDLIKAGYDIETGAKWYEEFVIKKMEDSKIV
ncbi:glycosyltransferase family 1 protein [Priestia aryabhattai]|uniref:glycosyltransferase family 1 protein n=1 Tax=Priestia aryabhattai TaxID=412384 RepID=UPI003D7F4CA0